MLLALFRAKDNVRLQNVWLIDENDNQGGAVKYGIAENRMAFAAGCSLHHRFHKRARPVQHLFGMTGDRF